MKNHKGFLEAVKFKNRRKSFYRYLKKLENSKIKKSEILENFPAFVGHMTLNRYLTLYEFYKMTKNIAGHIAEVGVYKGAGSIFFGKLIKIYQNETLTQVHGFDWFKGNKLGRKDSSLLKNGDYKSDYLELVELINDQDLSNIVKIHNLDVKKELLNFFETNNHLRFKMIFLDAGLYNVLKIAIPIFWDKLIKGGIIIFDQFSHELAPGETIAIDEYLPNQKILTLENAWMPNAYIKKE